MSKLGKLLSLVVVAILIWATTGCDTLQIKAKGSEKTFDWGVGARF